MFKKLYKKIYMPILFISLTLIAFIDAVAIVLQAKTLNEAYTNMGERRISRALDAFELYISSAAAFTYNLSVDADIIAKATDADSRSITSKLDTVCNYSLKMDAVTLYSADGTAYTSSTVTQIPELNKLGSEKEIAEFISSDAGSMISVRTNDVAGVYYNLPYPAASGVISCCQKVYRESEDASEQTAVGYLFTDILPANLYAHVFAEGQFKDAIAFISSADDYLEYGDNIGHGDMLDNNNRNYFEYTGTTNDGLFTITVFDSKSDYKLQVTKLASIMIAASAILIVFVFIAARQTAKSVTSRLDKLAKKMSDQKI